MKNKNRSYVFRRFISIIPAMVMLLMMTAVRSLTVNAADTAHDHSDWIPWNSATALPSGEGSYYLTMNVTLSEQWQPKENITICLNGYTIKDSEYTVSFDYHDATSDNGTKSLTVMYVEKYGALPVPKKKGFLFRGWFTAANGSGTEIKADTVVNITSAQTLYAHWIECQHEDIQWANKDKTQHSGICDECEKEVSEEHNWQSEVTTLPSEETDGEIHHTCPECGAKTTEVIPKHEHDFNGEWKHDENKRWHECPIDGMTDTPIPHSWDGGKITTAATAAEKGEKPTPVRSVRQPG